MNRIAKTSLGTLLVLAGSCTKRVNYCESDADCKDMDIAYPFCDVNGEYPASGGVKNVCTIVPSDCPVERCGCSPGATTCSGDQLSMCNPDGQSATTTACALGCADSGDRCLGFKPANGLDGAMMAAAGETDVVFPANVAIDTDHCTVHDVATNQPVQVKSQLLSQVSAPSICALYARSLDVSGASVTGANAVAFVATGPVVIRGLIDAAAKSPVQVALNAGPGSVTVGACVGQYIDLGNSGDAGGGGGNATGGADGLSPALPPIHRPGGLAQTNFEPLIGGCLGGDPLSGGGGGGAIQIDSFAEIRVLGTAFVAIGGAGGQIGFGGGSGGTAFFEAPKVEISGGMAANGGGGGFGGSCPASGANASNDETPAPGGVATCGSAPGSGGAGGTRTSAPTIGTMPASGAGGGGAVGRILIRTKDGTFVGPGSIFSIVATTEALNTR